MATIKTNLKANGKITSIEEALEASNLLFSVGQCEVMGTNGLFIPDKKVLFREDNNTFWGWLGLNIRLFIIMMLWRLLMLLKDENAVYTEAISKDGGAVSIIKATYDRRDEIRPGDIMERQIVIKNGFDSAGFSVSFQMNRLVCMNSSNQIRN